MERAALYIRLIVATIAAVVSSVFVWVYTADSIGVIRARLVGKEFFAGGMQTLADWSWHPVLIPIALLVFGILIIHRWKNKAAFELVIGCLWLFAFLWLLI